MASWSSHPEHADVTVIMPISTRLHTRKRMASRPRDLLPMMKGSMKQARKRFHMAFYPCMLTRPREGMGALVAIYVIAVIVIAVIWKPGHSPLDAIIVAVAAAWASAIPARALRRSW